MEFYLQGLLSNYNQSLNNNWSLQNNYTLGVKAKMYN